MVGFQKKADATEFGVRVKERLAEYGLEIAEEKSRIIPFGRYPFLSAEQRGKKLSTFDFLGFTFFCTKSRKGNFLLGRKTAVSLSGQTGADRKEVLTSCSSAGIFSITPCRNQGYITLTLYSGRDAFPKSRMWESHKSGSVRDVNNL